MKELLILMLVHYYQDSKRATNATITRRLDKSIRRLSACASGMPELVSGCRKLAEANKRKEREFAKKRQIQSMSVPLTGATHVPCKH